MDQVLESVEHLVGPALVVLQWVGAAGRRQPHRRLQVVQSGQVLAPPLIQHLQHDPAGELRSQLGLALAGVPGGGDQLVCHRDHLIPAPRAERCRRRVAQDGGQVFSQRSQMGRAHPGRRQRRGQEEPDGLVVHFTGDLQGPVTGQHPVPLRPDLDALALEHRVEPLGSRRSVSPRPSRRGSPGSAWCRSPQPRPGRTGRRRGPGRRYRVRRDEAGGGDGAAVPGLGGPAGPGGADPGRAGAGRASWLRRPGRRAAS